MSRTNREALLADDGREDLDASYSNFGDNGSSRSSSGGCLGTLRTWWADPRKRLYMVVILIAVVVFFAVTIGYAIVTRQEDTPSGPPAPPPYNPETPWLYPRLSNSTVPSHYALLEQIDISERQFSGHVNITVNISAPTDHIVLHALDLTCYGVTLTLDNGTVLTPAAWQYEANEYLVLNFTSLVDVQRAAVLHIKFAATLRADILAGLYASSYQNASGGVVWMAATQFAATDARRAFPCFDEPAMKATFALTVVSEPVFPTVLGNMPPISAYTRADGWTVTVFDTTPVMSTYLVSTCTTASSVLRHCAGAVSRVVR